METLAIEWDQTSIVGYRIMASKATCAVIVWKSGGSGMPDSATLISGCKDGTVMEWEAARLTETQQSLYCRNPFSIGDFSAKQLTTHCESAV